MRKVQSVQLHDNMFVSGNGMAFEVKKTITSKEMPGIQMSRAQDCIIVAYRGVDFEIPLVNCKNIVFFPEVAVEAKKK